MKNKDNKNKEPALELGTEVPSWLSELGTRIGEVTDLLGGRAATAKIIGKSEMQLGRYIKGESPPGIDVILALCRAATIRIEWISEGEEPMYARARTPIEDGWPTQESGADYAYLLPLYNVAAAAGHGAVVEHEEIVTYVPFPKDWIYNWLHANPSDLYFIYVQGDSMEPVLRAGEAILVNRNCSHAQYDGVFVLIMDGTLLVKRLQSLPGGRVRVSSDNPAYQPFEVRKSSLYPEDQAGGDGLAIIGRVVWAGRRM